MKKIVAILCCFLCLIISFPSIAESDIINSGNVTLVFAKALCDYSNRSLFDKIAPTASAAIILEIQDSMGSAGPLPFADIKSLINFPSWFGITNDESQLIIIGYYNEKQNIIICTYTPNKPIQYKIIKNEYSSDEVLDNNIPALFTNENVTEYKTILPEEMVAGFKQFGLTVTIDSGEQIEASADEIMTLLKNAGVISSSADLASGKVLHSQEDKNKFLYLINIYGASIFTIYDSNSKVITAIQLETIMNSPQSVEQKNNMYATVMNLSFGVGSFLVNQLNLSKKETSSYLLEFYNAWKQ